MQRLKAMSLPEIVYRVSQKRLVSKERKAFATKRPVFDVDCYGKIPQADLACLGLYFLNNEYSVGNEIELLGEYCYRDYRKRWHAAFQGEGDWPVRYAADYNFGADDVPGDIRTNWELNRHCQFALLAKSFFVSREKPFLDELVELFEDWNACNPFMWGPEWSSPMESAIRAVNWLTAAAFLNASGMLEVGGICRKLCNGAYVMAANVRLHYSRFSSANNHTIVEAAGVAIAACVFGRDDWRDEALDLLEREVALQTWSDGVNKEQALHYQLFVMEALCLVSHALKASGSSLPTSIETLLRSMAHYASACRVGDTVCVEFGDDDEGVIFNPCVEKPFYLGYVLAFVSLEVADVQRWANDCDSYEQLRWLFEKSAFEAVGALSLYKPRRIESFEQGGVTIVRSSDGRIVLAFDHGPLGFGPLAAHGHADALSVQLVIDGKPILIDPGTYIYNGNREKRDLFRSTAMHNTVCVNGANQSEMLGPFLWGRKAKAGSFEVDDSGDVISLAACHDGYSPAIHRRLIYLSDSILRIVDEVDCAAQGAAVCFHMPKPEDALGICLTFAAQEVREVRSEFKYSPAYGALAEGVEIKVPFEGQIVSEIHFEKDGR